MTRNRWIAAGAIAVVVLIAGLAAVAALGRLSTTATLPVATPSPSLLPSVSPSLSPEITESASPEPSRTVAPSAIGVAIDGMPVFGSVIPLPVAVMVDDNVIARPQSGFNAASIVYQAPADGGEDRYMLVFQELPAPDIGPVRSGRPYFVRWAADYRAGFGHYGGDQFTKDYLPTIDGRLIYDIDALRHANDAYHRIDSRPAPHNAYTNIDALRTVAQQLGAPDHMVAGLAARLFKDDAAEADRPPSASISIPYYRGATAYSYDRATNSYLRSVAGSPQIDAADGKQVTAKDVVVLFMVLTTDSVSEPGHDRPVLANVGSGKAIVFRDGQAVVGTWKKPDVGALTRFYDGSGQEIALDRGRIFIQAVPTGTNVTYKAG